MESKIAHLKMIQAVIQRLANSSLVTRGWAITLAAGMFAIAAKDANKNVFLVAYIPVFIFWVLDSYYLAAERAFRGLYDEVALKRESEIDFKMKVSVTLTSWGSALLSLPTFVYYFSLAGAILVVVFVIKSGAGTS